MVVKSGYKHEGNVKYRPPQEAVLRLMLRRRLLGINGQAAVREA